MPKFKVEVQHPELGKVERTVEADSIEAAEAMLAEVGLPVSNAPPPKAEEKPEPKAEEKPEPKKGRAAKKDD